MAKGGAPNEIKAKKEEKEIAELNDKIDAEYAEWQKAGIDPKGVGINGYMLNAKVMSMLDMIEEELGITEQTANLYFKRRVLQELTEDRMRIVPAMEEAQRQEQAAQVLALPQEKKLLGPDGQPIKH
jgi:hypothetical protein